MAPGVPFPSSPREESAILLRIGNRAPWEHEFGVVFWDANFLEPRIHSEADLVGRGCAAIFIAKSPPETFTLKKFTFQDSPLRKSNPEIGPKIDIFCERGNRSLVIVLSSKEL